MTAIGTANRFTESNAITLIKFGADTNLKNNDGEDALKVANDYGFNKVIQFLK